jgi:hypothetical protein
MPGSISGALPSRALATQAVIRRWPCPPNVIPRSVAPKLPAGRSSEQPTSFVSIMACRKSRSSRIPGVRLRPAVFAGSCPDQVERLVFFEPVTWRQKKAEPQSFSAWRLISLEDQWDRFTVEVPPGESAVFSKRHFEEWGPFYLGHIPGESDALASERQDAERSVAGHRRRRLGQRCGGSHQPLSILVSLVSHNDSAAVSSAPTLVLIKGRNRIPSEVTDTERRCLLFLYTERQH